VGMSTYFELLAFGKTVEMAETLPFLELAPATNRLVIAADSQAVVVFVRKG